MRSIIADGAPGSAGRTVQSSLGALDSRSSGRSLELALRAATRADDDGAYGYRFMMDEDLDVASLSDAELKDRIRRIAERPSSDSAPAQRELDSLRIELVRRARARHSSGEDAGGPDSGGVREPTRPIPPGGGAAIQLTLE
jgi:hypothetical protein